jgi:hypothetical protein
MGYRFGQVNRKKKKTTKKMVFESFMGKQTCKPRMQEQHQGKGQSSKQEVLCPSFQTREQDQRCERGSLKLLCKAPRLNDPPTPQNLLGLERSRLPNIIKPQMS